MVPSETPKDPGFENWLRSALDQTPLPADLEVSREAVTSRGRRIRARRQVARRGLLGLAAVAVIGVSVPLLNETFSSGQGDVAGSCATASVIDAAGAERALTVVETGADKVETNLFPSPDCYKNPSQRPIATDTVSIPESGDVTTGQVSAMSFYLVKGNVTQASVNGVAATVVDSGGQRSSVIWPNQSAARSVRPEPPTISWTIGKRTYTQRLAAR